VLSLTVHILSLFGIQAGGSTLFFFVQYWHISALWMPAVFVTMKLTGLRLARSTNGS
jgi:hypothetical protein